MRSIIVEDSRLARLEMQELLRAHPEVAVVAEAENVEQAMACVEKHQPDLIFLDINLPDGDGFELLAELGVCPHVIFVTAYDQHALRAFEVNALDYLLKPVNPARLAAALAKIPEPVTELPIDHKVFVKDGDRCWLIDLNEVWYIQSQGNYVQLHLANKKPMVYKSLSHIEPRLQPKQFIRINRQYIVNINYIKNIETMGQSNLLLTMVDDTEIEVSRRLTSQFKKLLSL